jgi:uncharacterized caspase-like protein
MGAIWTNSAMAERRVALVIGNSKYEHADMLANTINDANAIAQLFTKAGFDVVDERRDVGVVEFKRAVREFLNAAANADIAVVYYSGHGMEVGGSNYLIPVDAKLASAFDVDDEAVPLDRILLATQPAKKLSLIILDACRENPFLRAEGHLPATRSVAARLIGVEPTSADSLVAYAAKAGSLSYDGVGPNSPFTTALVKYITQPGLDIRIALGKVRDEVLESTGNRQEPFVYGSLGGDNVSLAPGPGAVEAAKVASSNTATEDYQMAERLGSPDGWRAFLSTHGSGYYAELARAQLSKLGASETAKSSVDASSRVNVASAATASDTRVADAPPPKAAPPQKAQPAKPPQEPAQPKAQQETPKAQQAGNEPSKLQEAAQPSKPQQVAVLEPPALARSAPQSTDSICQRDRARLAQLRINPSVDEVRKFEQEMACESLRPQVNRLAESLGLEAIAAKTLQSDAAAQPAEAPTPAPKSQAGGEGQVCSREEAELAKLRADPEADKIAQFAGSFACEKLRAQVQRLAESYGVKIAPPPPSTQGAAHGFVAPAAEKPDAPTKPVDSATVCKQETDELSRLRANPDPEAAQQFAHKVQCPSLKAQAARLLESLGVN